MTPGEDTGMGAMDSVPSSSADAEASFSLLAKQGSDTHLL